MTFTPSKNPEKISPLNTDAEIEGMPAVRGIVHADTAEAERGRGRGIPLELFYGHTDHHLTLESPTELDMEVRVAAHMVALNAVVEAHLPKSV